MNVLSEAGYVAYAYADSHIRIRTLIAVFLRLRLS
jgi:hypothetical protein